MPGGLEIVDTTVKIGKRDYENMDFGVEDDDKAIWGEVKSFGPTVWQKIGN